VTGLPDGGVGRVEDIVSALVGVLRLGAPGCWRASSIDPRAGFAGRVARGRGWSSRGGLARSGWRRERAEAPEGGGEVGGPGPAGLQAQAGAAGVER
jgi:hypothetical protein